MNANAFLQKDYENETTLRPKKTNPNKPNSNPMTLFLRKSTWGRLTAESLRLLITQGIVRDVSYIKEYEI